MCWRRIFPVAIIQIKTLIKQEASVVEFTAARVISRNADPR